MLSKSRHDLHALYTKTYGPLYEENAEIFTSLYSDLDAYYLGDRDLDLVQALDRFFGQLFRKMFTLLNKQYPFDEAYLRCVTEYMRELKPFGDVPNKLSVQVKRAMVAARTFVQGLHVAKHVLTSSMQLPVSPTCEQASMALWYCPYCEGLGARVKPCTSYCNEVMKGCLQQHHKLDKEWRLFVDALLNLADRIEGPFNMEAVIDPIDVKISDAIMNLQINGQAVSKTIFTGCGQPRLKRSATPERRNKPDDEIQFQTLQFHDRNKGALSDVDKLVSDMRKKMKSIQNVFGDGLDEKMCPHERVTTEDGCWDGVKIGEKETSELDEEQAVSEPIDDLAKSSEDRAVQIVREMINTLKTMTEKMKLAYGGYDVTWMDIESSSYDGDDREVASGDGGIVSDDEDFSGSGSGSGSDPMDHVRVSHHHRGDGTDDTESGPDDDDREMEEAGSGDGWGTHYPPHPPAHPLPPIKPPHTIEYEDTGIIHVSVTPHIIDYDDDFSIGEDGTDHITHPQPELHPTTTTPVTTRRYYTYGEPSRSSPSSSSSLHLVITLFISALLHKLYPSSHLL